jgi:nucleotide-binding universal stress UspA family protein
MLEFNNILIPNDFSENFNIAFEYAKELTKGRDSLFHIIHVVEPVYVPVDTAIYPNMNLTEVRSILEKNAKEQLDKSLNTIDADNTKIKTQILKGIPEDAIIEYAKENNIDVICISTSGSSGFEHFLFGSTTEKLLRHAECPVIAVKMP